MYNASNNELVRTNTIVKGCIVSIDATPFKAWFEKHYSCKIGAKGEVTKDDLIGEELELKLPGEKTIKIIVDEASLKHTRGTIPTFSISGYYYPNLTASASEASTGGGSGA